MLPPDLYRSEAFAEDLPEGGYEPLALRPAPPQGPPARRGRGLLGALRAAFGARHAPPSQRDGPAAVQAA
jgi:hypothetical protein